MINNQLINFQDKLYTIRRRIMDDPKYMGANLDIIMKWMDSDKVLRKEGYLFFLKEIEEAEVLAWLPKNN